MTPLPDAMVKLRDELAEKYRPDVPIDPEGPMLSKFMNSIHRETRDGFKAGWDAKAAYEDEGALKVAFEALNKFPLSEINQNRLDEVDTETLRMIILHSSSIAIEAIATIEKLRGKA